MKNRICPLCIIACFVQAHAQSPDSWKQMASLGGAPTPRQGAVSFNIGKKGYLGLGNQGSEIDSRKDFWEYDPATGIWTQRADFVGGERSYAVGFSIGNMGHIGTGGFNGNNDFWQYGPSTNTWTRKAARSSCKKEAGRKERSRQ